MTRIAEKKPKTKTVGKKPKTKNLTPGTKTPVSGQYKVVGEKREVTGVKGKRLPPGPKKGIKYNLVDKSKSKSKK